jgi:NitT/TauT family transport system ATP-binding protein
MERGTVSVDAKNSDFALRLNGVCFSHPTDTDSDRPIFRDLSLSFAKGEFVAIFGPSGCGKTTLLDLIAGVKFPSLGRVEFGPSIGRIGYLFQEYPFLPRKTVSQHISFPLLTAGVRRAEAIVVAREWARRVGLEAHTDDPIEHLSTGMKARVALATVLIAEPGIVIMDEPFRSLDLDTRVRMWEVTRYEHSRTRPLVLLVTHDIGDAVVLADRALILGHPPCPPRELPPWPQKACDDPFELLRSPLGSSVSQNLWSELQAALSPRGNSL